jgi:transposase
MKPYSQDLRDRIIEALEANVETRQEIAGTFGVSRSHVQKVWRRWRDTGNRAAQPHSGGRSRTLATHTERLRTEVEQQPDVTLAELCERIAQDHGPHASCSMMCRELQRLNLPRKKKVVHASERDTPRVQALRADYRETMVEFIAKHLKFIDESGVHLSFTRLYGRAAPGSRLVDATPYQPAEKWTLVAALGLHTVEAPWMLPGNMTGDAFEVYVQRVLAPTLKRDDIVVMDRLPAHRVAGIEPLIRARGAHLQLLPPYSPDLNPIERCWAKIKTILRSLKPRTEADLLKAIKTALLAITDHDARAWFEYCGYCVHA